MKLYHVASLGTAERREEIREKMEIMKVMSMKEVKRTLSFASCSVNSAGWVRCREFG
jgi:hypothetical protein